MSVEQQNGLAAGCLAKSVLGMTRAVEVGKRNDAVITIWMCVGHDNVFFRQRLFEQIRVKRVNTFFVHAGQKDVMRVLQQIQPHNNPRRRAADSR